VAVADQDHSGVTVAPAVAGAGEFTGVLSSRAKKHSAAEPTILRKGSRCALNEHVADLSARAANATTLPNPNV
jgi:hypothetical protein